MKNAPAIIEKRPRHDFWRAVQHGRYDHVQLSAGSTQHRHRHASPNRDDCLDSGGTQMRRPICPSRAGFPTGRIHDMMTEAQVDFVLTEHAFAPKLSSFPIRYTDCEICGVETPPGSATPSKTRNAPPMCCIRQVPPGGPKVSVSPTAMFAIMSVPLPTSSIPAPVMSCCNIPSVLLTSLWRKCSPVC